jgi:hypothetical protein
MSGSSLRRHRAETVNCVLVERLLAFLYNGRRFITWDRLECICKR